MEPFNFNVEPENFFRSIMEINHDIVKMITKKLVVIYSHAMKKRIIGFKIRNKYFRVQFNKKKGI